MPSTSQQEQSEQWLMWPRPNPAGRLRLICIPYGGGGAQIFHTWPDLLPAEVEVCAVNLPGHGRRLTEPAISELPKLVEVLSPMVPRDRPFALFGHSMGALLSFELARRFSQDQGCRPLHLFVSGCYAPHLPDPHPIHALPDAEFVEELRCLNGIPKEVQQNQELMELMLPTLRADFKLTETYVYRSEPPLQCGITVYGGWTDPLAPRGLLDGWRQHTIGKFSVRMFPGDHFFVHSAQELLLGFVSSELKQLYPVY
jgi:medium-chain acyl-[acyl-carrier-protein] hydrolase